MPDTKNKRQSIVTNDSKDPRLKAYSDSLNLYNSTNKFKAAIDKYGTLKNPYLKTEFQKAEENNYGTANNHQINSLVYGDTWSENGNPTTGYHVNVFKKPVQPIIYQKSQKRKVDLSTVDNNNLQQNSFDPTFSIPDNKVVPYSMQGKTPVYGPANSLIGMMGDKEFYPDYLNDAKRTPVNQADSDLIQNGLSDYLKTKGVNKPIKSLGNGGTLYQRYANGTQSFTGNPEKDQALEGVIGAIPQAAAFGASLVGQGDETGFRTQAGIIGNKALTGMSAGAQVGKIFGPKGALIGGAVGTGVGALSGLIGARGAQKKWLAEQQAMNTTKLLEDNNLSGAKIAGDESLILGNKYKEMYRTGGSITVPGALPSPKPITQSAPSSDAELDTVPSYLFYLHAAKTGNTEGMKNALDGVRRTRGPQTAANLQYVGNSMKTISLRNMAKRNISAEQDPQIKKLYSMVNDNPDIMNKYEYFMPQQPAIAKKSTGGPIDAPLSKMYMNGGYAKSMSSGTTELVGNSHEQGGIKSPELGAELENNETTSGNFVFSDKLGFAQMHKPIAKAMGKIENKPMSRERMNSMRLLKGQENKLALMQEHYKQLNGIQ